MQRDADTFISNNDRAFILKALQEERRLDGRGPYEYRKLKFQFSLDDSSCTLTMGGGGAGGQGSTTRVMAVISANLEAPYPDRPNEGSIRFNVEAGPMASPAFEAGRPGPAAVELARLVERALKGSGAADTEALCVLAGRKVWALRVDVHVLDHGGNLVDGCVLAALGALMAFRRPEVSLGGPNGTDLIVHPPEQKEPLPLTIHHLPVAVTFALFEDGGLIAVDPTLKEEAARSGSATLVVNPNKEVCAVHKADGVGLTSTQLMRLVRLACGQVERTVAELKKALEAHGVARVQARVRRARNLVGLPEAGRHVSISSADGQQQQPDVQGSGAAAGAAGQGMRVKPEEEEVAAGLQAAAEMGIDVPEETSSSEEDSEEDGDEEGSSSEEEEEVPAPAARKGGKQQKKGGADAMDVDGAGAKGKKGSQAGGQAGTPSQGKKQQGQGEDGLLPGSGSLKVATGAKGAAKAEAGAGSASKLVGAPGTTKGRSPLQSPKGQGPRTAFSGGKPSPGSGPGSGPPSATGPGAGGRKRPWEVKEDPNLEAIAAVIAGAAKKAGSLKAEPMEAEGGGEEEVLDLKDAVKPKAGKAGKAKKGKA